MSQFKYTGVDYAWAHPDPALLRAKGFKFAMRYLSPDAGKNLSKAEIVQLKKNGIVVGLVWESTAGRAKGGHEAGSRDAIAADHQAGGLGLGHLPIYFAVDFDATMKDMPLIADYFNGVTAMIGRSRTGVYGGYHVVKYLSQLPDVKWFWQTYAWSGGLVHPAADIYQYKNAVNVGTWKVDLNKATEHGKSGMSGYRPAVNRRLVAYYKRQERAFGEYLRVHRSKHPHQSKVIDAATKVYYFYKAQRRKAEKGDLK